MILILDKVNDYVVIAVTPLWTYLLTLVVRINLSNFFDAIQWDNFSAVM